jgi:phosphoribosyl-ATP pyrophosphohydrolase/phosphoribosyl-AMP cyclohydrolase
MTDTPKIDVSGLDFAKLDGILPAVIQDYESGQVLMLGFMNKEAVRLTLQEGWVVFWSRTRRRLWRKGEESGNVLRLKSIAVDCDSDSLLIRVRPQGPVCHTGARSCFEQ